MYKKNKRLIKNKKYPFPFLLKTQYISLKKSIYISFLYLSFSLFILGLIHYFIIRNGFSINQKMIVLVFFYLIFTILFFVNKEKPFIIINLLLGITIVFFTIFHEFMSVNYKKDYHVICNFKDKENFMFIPRWMPFMYLSVFYIIIIIYKLTHYYFYN